MTKITAAISIRMEGDLLPIRREDRCPVGPIGILSQIDGVIAAQPQKINVPVAIDLGRINDEAPVGRKAGLDLETRKTRHRS